jgi:predicted nucleotide-binding protein
MILQSGKLTKVLLLLKEGTEIFSDFSGIIQHKFKSDVKEIYKAIEKNLKSIRLI